MTARHEDGCYVISVAARLLGTHVQTLRYYERVGLIAPSRSHSNIRLYSEQDLQRIREVKRLMDDLGVNLAGAEVALKLMDRIEELEKQVVQLTEELGLVRGRAQPRARQS